MPCGVRHKNRLCSRPSGWITWCSIASYGLQGNIDKNTSPFLLGTYRSEYLPGVSEDVIIINSAPNKKLRWEKTQSVNAGFDFSVLNQAINLSVDYYYRKGTDLIALRMLPLETGFNNERQLGKYGEQRCGNQLVYP